MAKIQTVGDLKKFLNDLPDHLPLIYSHDDEGNEFQKVIYSADIRYIEKTDKYRSLEIVDPKTEEEKANCEKCVLIN